MTMSDQAITIAWIELLRSDPPQWRGNQMSLDGTAKCAMGYLLHDITAGRSPRWIHERHREPNDSTDGWSVSTEVIRLNDLERKTLPEIAEYIRDCAIRFGVLKTDDPQGQLELDRSERKEVARV
jgi:hypothetical protein